MLSLHWFKNDLRIHDNPALSHATKQDLPTVGLYILQSDPHSAQAVWERTSLEALEKSLKELKIPLIIAEGDDVWEKILKHHRIGYVTWNKSFEPRGIKRDRQIEKLLSSHEIPFATFNGTLLLEPTAFTTGSGDFYKVFTPYYNMHQKVYEPPAPVPKVHPNSSFPRIEHYKHSELKTHLIALEKCWEPGEKGAHKRLKHFASHRLTHYAKGRDYPAQEAHSGLSPHLHFGELSPHTVVRTCPSSAFVRELVFRDFAAQLLYHIPHLDTEPMKPQFSKWKWDNNPTFFKAWKNGMTGYPIVDAGMRELLHTGFMHNRVRMIVASFLVKDLNIAWQKGADWFLERLLDADLAQNSFNWQWSAGTGPDAQPFFRIFNPILQSQKFDPDGLYIKKWVPELKTLSGKSLHMPWETVGHTYPAPIVNHDVAKKWAVQEYRRITK